MQQAELDGVYRPSEDIVVREIEGELVIVPLTAGIGDMEDELYSLNETGKAFWSHLDGQASLSAIVCNLAAEYEAPEGKIEADVLGLAEELLRRKILIPAAKG